MDHLPYFSADFTSLYFVLMYFVVLPDYRKVTLHYTRPLIDIVIPAIKPTCMLLNIDDCIAFISVEEYVLSGINDDAVLFAMNSIYSSLESATS
jgi:hypothetical protein